MCVSTVVAKYQKAFQNCISHVPCGHCYECVRKRKLDWEIRLTVESCAWPHKFFSMLTYNDECYHSDVQHSEIAYFIKRLRYNLNKYYSGATLKYFLVSEFGELKDRLHYHVLFFVSKEFDDTFREFQELVKMSWMKKIPLTEEEILFRKDIYKKNQKRLKEEKRKDLYRWSRRKYDEIPLGFATAQNLKHGSAVGSIHYACKYIQKQYNKMYYSRIGFNVWKDFMVESNQFVPNWNREMDDKIGALHPYSYTGTEYPTFPIRGKSFPVPARWMQVTVGKYHTTLLRKDMADRLFEENGPKFVDFKKQAYHEYKESERFAINDIKHEQHMLSRLHESSCRNDFVMTDLEWEMSMTPKPSSPCPVEVDSTSVIEIPLPLKWLS